MKSRLDATVATVAVALTVLTACSTSPSPSPAVLEVTGGPDGRGGTSMDEVAPNTPWVFSGPEVCLSRAGSVAIEQVALYKPSGSIRILDWAVHPEVLTDEGAFAGELRDVPNSSHNPVTTPCAPGEDGTPSNTTALDVEVASTNRATTASNGLVITFRSGKHDRTLYLPFYITLCFAKISKKHDCPTPDFSIKP